MKRKVLVVIVGCIFVIGIAGSVCSAKTVKLKVPGGKIRCFYHESRGEIKRPAVLILPGLGGIRGSKREIYWSFARWLNKKYNFSVLAIDYLARSNEEVFRLAKEHGSQIFFKREVTTALEFLRKKENVDKDKIGVLGSSFGTELALLTAGREDCVKTVVLLSLITVPREHPLWSEYNPYLVESFAEYSGRSDLSTFFIGDKKDDMPRNKSNAAANALSWSQQVKGEAKIEITNGGLHSAELLEVRRIKKAVGEWLQKYLM